jgi:hypothetical protein
VSRTKVVAERENILMNWSQEEKNNIPPKYGCEILLEDTTLENVKNPSYPNDAYVVYYKIEDKASIDLCRGSKVRIFDLYYDKFGPGVVQKIDFGYGRTNPKLWGYKAPEKKKRK